MMKKLEMNQMEKLQGGGRADYCNTLGGWVRSGGVGYQGDMNDVYALYVRHCAEYNY